MQIVSLHEKIKPLFSEEKKTNKKNVISLLSIEFAQRVNVN